MRLENSLPHTLQNWARSSFGALQSGFQGLLNSSKQHEQASQNLLEQSSGGWRENSSEGIGVSVQISSEYRQLQAEGQVQQRLASAEESVATIQEAGVTYSASARIVKATSSMLDALFDAIA